MYKGSCRYTCIPALKGHLMTWEELEKQCNECTKCDLCKTKTNTVFGCGNRNADIIFIFGGTNDFGHGDAPIGDFNDRTVDTFYGALHVLYTKMIEKYPEATIIVATPLHRINEYSLYIDGVNKKHYTPLVKYVDIIKEVARYYSLPVCDLYAISGLQPEVPIIKEKYILVLDTWNLL